MILLQLKKNSIILAQFQLANPHFKKVNRGPQMRIWTTTFANYATMLAYLHAVYTSL